MLKYFADLTSKQGASLLLYVIRWLLWFGTSVTVWWMNTGCIICTHSLWNNFSQFAWLKH